MNKKLSVLFIFMLLFQSMSGGLAMATAPEDQSDTHNIFTDVWLTDADGNTIGEGEQPETEAIDVHVDWTLDKTPVEEVKDTYSLKLPEQVAVDEEKQGDVEYDNVAIGAYTLATDGELVVSFNDNAADQPDALGELIITDLGYEAKEKPQPAAEGNQNSDENNQADETGQSEENQSEENDPDVGQAGNNEDQGKDEKEPKSAEKKKSKKESVPRENKEKMIDTLAELQENIFTFKSLTHDDNEIVDGSIIDVGDGEKVQLELEWDTEGIGAHSGDTASMQLPDIFKQVTILEKDIITSGVNVGTYRIQEGELTFEFNDKIEDGDISNGKVGLNLDFDLTKFEENIEQVIEFNDSENTTLNVIARPNQTASDITKEGQPDRYHNAKEITWTVDVINNTDETVSNATLNDTLPEGLSSPENLVVKSLLTGLHGDKSEGEEVGNFSGNITGGISFDELKPFEGYRVEYTTPITDKDKTKFTNDASFFNGTKDLPAKATVSGLTTSNPIEKSGEYNGNTGQIDWTIVANENGNDIDNVVIEDNLPDGLTVDQDTLKVKKYVDASSNGEITIDSAEFPLKLGETAADEHYVIDFSTDIDYGVINDGEYQKQNEFTNTVILKDGEDELGDDDATINFDREPLLEKKGKSEVDYHNKTLSWTIDVNRANHPLNNLIITDLIPAGLSIDENDIKITDQDGNDFPAESIDINPADGGKQEVVMNLNEVGTKHLTIEYTTGIEDFNVNTFNNAVSMDGDGIGEGDHDTDGTVKPSGNSFDKSFKGIDYKEKIMDWSLKVDPRREAISSLKIEDTFPNKGMILDPSTVEVSHSNDGKLVKGEDYTLESRTEDSKTGYHKGFIIELIGDSLPLDGGYLAIDYQTSYDPQFKVKGDTLDPHVNTEKKERVYENNANYSGTTENDNDFDVNKDASTKVRQDSWNSGKKEGQRVHEDSEGNLKNGWESGSERKIAWQLYTNYQEQNLGSDVVITDTLDYNGEIDEDSIKVSTFEVNAKGETTITDDELDSNAYEVTVSGNEFTLTFDDSQDVDKRYVVEFLTTVPDLSQETYTNQATVKVGDEDYPYSGTVDYRDYDDFLDKSAIGQEGSDVYIGDEVNWEVQINDSLSVINEAEITDTISAGLEYVKGTLEITTADGSFLSEGTDYTLSNTKTEAGKTVLSIELHDTLKRALTLNYTTVVTAEDGDTVSNKIALDGKNFEEKTITSEELTAEQFSWVEGEFNENRGALRIVKSDSESEEAIASNPATFELYYDLNGEHVKFGDQYKTNQDGELLIGNLPLRTYYIKEIEAPTGYIIDKEEQEIDITDAYGAEEKIYETEFTNTKKTTDISVTKEWDDQTNQDGTRPDAIEAQLLTDGEAIGDVESLSESNDWQHTWENLDEYHSTGDKIDYTVKEVNVPEGYESASKSDEEGNITITNTHEPETIEVSVSKEWDDAKDQDGVRPNNVTVNLLDGSKVVKKTVLDADNGWQHTFTNLPKFADGEEIEYKVTEDSVDHYSTTVQTTNTEKGLDSVITNAYTLEKTTATVTKVWEDGNNQDGNRPKTVTVQLLANGEPHGEPVAVAATDNWTYIWEGLDLKTEGEPIEYTIEEKDIPEDYEVSLDNEDHGNLMITNAYEPEETDISVSKDWNDNENQDGVRPDNIKINLLADGEIESTMVLKDEDEWKHTFTGLPVNENGEKINYTVTEDTVTDYSTSIETDPETEADHGYVVTNTHTPKQTSVTVTKSWEDAHNQDGNRPDSIEVQLTADGEPVRDAVTLSDSDDWSYTWNELDLYVDGEKIDYSVKEPNVPEGYTVTVNDKDHGNIMITNSYTPEKTEVPVTKVWDDADDQDGERPDHIKLNLLNDRGEVVKSAVVQDQDSNEWQYTFTDIPKYENGKEINYQVTEDFVSDYATSIEEDAEVQKGFIIENAYTPEKTSVNVTKGWNDADNQDGNRPDSIEVQLTADGEPVGDAETLSEDDDWTHTWNELDLYADGEEIDYSVKEMNVPKEYTVTMNDKDHGNIIITNSYTPEVTEVPVTKTWKDDHNHDGTRPDFINVDLLANSKIEETVFLTEANDWSYNFTDLPKYEFGEEIEYTLAEDDVKGYDTSVDGFDITNLRVGKTDVAGEKIWQDNDDATGNRPDTVTVKLLQNGEVFAETEVTAEDDWTYSFDNLPRFDDEGVEWGYTVDEEEVDGYDKSAGEGHDLVNTRTGKTEVTVNKSWQDEDKTERPETITVNLLQNGTVFTIQDVTKDDNWSYTFEHLPKFDDQGKAYNYTVTEHDVAGYESDVDGFDITNTRTDEKSIEITKSWIDDEDFADRPEAIGVELFRSIQDGDKESVDTYNVTAVNEWKLEIAELPAYNDEGKAYTYEIEEEAVDGYETDVNGFDLTNTRTGETVVTGEKTWLDGDGSDRPDAIIVNLLQNGNEIDSASVTANDDWAYSFKNLDEFDEAGVAYDYTIEEEPIDGYETTIDDYDLTNTRTGQIDLDVVKEWKNDSVEDRPDSITIDLLQNGNVIKTVDVTADMDWTYTFTDMDAYTSNGSTYDYTVQEHDVDGYQSTVKQTDDAFTITNTREETPTKPEDPEDPEEPGDPQDSDDPENPEQPGTSEDTDDAQSDSGETMPKTATNLFNLLALGALLTLIGLGLTVLGRNRSSKSTK